MGNRLLVFISLLLLLLLGIKGPTYIKAQEEPASSGIAIPGIIPPPETDPGFLGQDHSYSVTFRGNGEAVVSLKVALTNKGDTSLSKVLLRIPRVEPREIFVYQVLREPVCIRYLTNNLCAETQEPDYYGYYWSKAKYQKAESDYSGDTLTLTLPQPIAANKSGSFFIYYRTLGYAEKNLFGAYKFTFETLQVEDDIRNLTVGISTDSDLVLRGATGEVNYRFEDASSSLKAVGGVAPAESSAIDTFYNQIGYGSLIKTASSLAPWESYTVTSSFAENRLKLYAKEALIGLGIFWGLLAAVIVVARIVLKRTASKVQAQSSARFESRTLVLALGVSLASSLLVAGYTVLAIVAVNFLTRTVGYEFQQALLVFLVVISFVVYCLFLFGPGVYLGVKKGVGWGIATLFLTVFWMLLFLGVGLLIYLSLRIPDNPTFMPLGGVETRQY